MYNPIPKTPYSEPLYLGVIILKFFRQSICCFANYFKISNYGINCFRVSSKGFKGMRLGIQFNFVNKVMKAQQQTAAKK